MGMIMKIEVEICDNWNGLDKVCDSNRCAVQLEQCRYECYHKPYTINEEKKTVIEAMLIFLRQYKTR
jgi:hypothetical protein